MADPPELVAAASKRGWDRARKAVAIGSPISSGVLAAGRTPQGQLTSMPMQRLAEIGRGDPDAIRYGLNLDLTQRRDDEKS